MHQGTHLYTQLDRLARPSVFGIAGIVMRDVDEGNNRLYFGVTT